MFQIRIQTPFLTRLGRSLVPERPVDKPEVSDRVYDLNLQLSAADDALNALGTLEDRLGELDLYNEEHRKGLDQIRLDLEGKRMEILEDMG